MSGPAAEERHARYPKDVRSRLWRVYWKTDRANAEHWLGKSGARAPTLAQCENMARYLVDQHWAAIGRVAAALAAERELSGVALDRLWRAGK